jgi:hypothetical protein
MEKFFPLKPGRYYRCTGPRFPHYQGVIVWMEDVEKSRNNRGKVIFVPDKGHFETVGRIWRSSSSDQYEEITEEEVLMYKMGG